MADEQAGSQAGLWADERTDLVLSHLPYAAFGVLSQFGLTEETSRLLRANHSRRSLTMSMCSKNEKRVGVRHTEDVTRPAARGSPKTTSSVA